MISNLNYNVTAAAALLMVHASKGDSVAAGRMCNVHSQLHETSGTAARSIADESSVRGVRVMDTSVDSHVTDTATAADGRKPKLGDAAALRPRNSIFTVANITAPTSNLDVVSDAQPSLYKGAVSGIPPRGRPV